MDAGPENASDAKRDRDGDNGPTRRLGVYRSVLTKVGSTIDSVSSDSPLVQGASSSPVFIVRAVMRSIPNIQMANRLPPFEVVIVRHLFNGHVKSNPMGRALLDERFDHFCRTFASNVPGPIDPLEVFGLGEGRLIRRRNRVLRAR